MLLPGISGSFLLLILGAYAPVLLAVKTLDVPKIAAFGGIGALLGLADLQPRIEMVLASHRPHLGRVDWVFGGFASGALALEGPSSPLVHPQRRTGGMDAGKHLGPPSLGRSRLPRWIGRLWEDWSCWGLQRWGRRNEPDMQHDLSVACPWRVGHPVEHSQSPELFKTIFQSERT